MSDWMKHFERQHPLFLPLSTFARRFTAADAWPTLNEYNALAAELGVKTASGRPLTFVNAPKKPRHSRRRQRASNSGSTLPYERQVFEYGEVQTRPGHWHDFFNMLVWTHFPSIKARLNERQVLARVESSDFDVRLGRRRTRELDRLTMFDEGGMLLVTRPDETAAWREALTAASPAAMRKMTAAPAAFLVGHAIYEALIMGNTAVRAMAYIVERDPSFFEQSITAQVSNLDGFFASLISANRIFAAASSPFVGFPVGYCESSHAHSACVVHRA